MSREDWGLEERPLDEQRLHVLVQIQQDVERIRTTLDALAGLPILYPIALVIGLLAYIAFKLT